MANTDHMHEGVAKRLVELSASMPPIHSFNRQFARVLLETVGAEAVTLWLLRENELVLCEQIEERTGVAQSIRLPENRQQEALRASFENNELRVLEEGPGEFDPFRPPDDERRTIVFLPIAAPQGNIGAVRVLLPDSRDRIGGQLRLAESLCGYYSLYHAHQMLRLQQEQRQFLDRLNKAILQLHHYALSRNLPEVIANSTIEVAPIDRAIVLLRGRDNELKISAVSSVATPDRKSAWSRLVRELGDAVARTGEPLYFHSGSVEFDEIEDEALREKVKSYLLMTDVSSLLVYPAQVGDRNVGVLVLEKKGEQPLNKFERMLCTVFAGHVTSSIANHQLVHNDPLHRILARRIEPALEGRSVKRGARRTGKLAAWGVGLVALAALVWFVGFHRVHEKVGAACFVQPFQTRIITSKLAGEIERVHFDQGDRVGLGNLLLQLQTDDIEVQLAAERENLKILEAQVTQLRGEVEQPLGETERSERLARIAVLQHSLTAKQHEVELLENKLDDCFVRAPISGTVLEPEEPERMIGVVVRSGELLCRIGQVGERVRIRVAVPAERAAEVEAGQQVELHLRPLVTERTIRGTIEDVASRSVTYKNANVFMADVIVENPLTRTQEDGSPSYLLKPGMTGKAKVILPEKSVYASIYGRMLYRKLKYALF